MALEDFLVREDLPPEVREALRRHLAGSALRDAKTAVEGTLRASEERYRRLTGAVTDYIYSVRVVDGRVVATHHTDACETVTGYGSEEYAADPFLWLRMVFPADRPLVDEQARRALAGEDVPPIEHRLVRKDGSVRWIRNTVVLHRDEKGSLLGYDGLVTDVTERRQAQEALRTSEERYRALVEQSALGIGISHKDQIVYANPALLRLFGYDDPAEFAAIPWLDHVAPSWRERMAELTHRLLQGEPIPEHLECEILRRDGETRTLAATRSQITLGGATYAQTTFQDVTERKRAEQALRESELKFRMMADQAPIMIGVTDRAGNIRFLNRTWLDFRGRTLAEEAGWAWAEALHPADHDRVRAAMESAIRSHQPYSVEYRIQDRTGRYRWILDTASPLLDVDGRPEGYIGTALDISERKQAEEALRESELRYRLLFEMESDALFLVDNETGRVLEANDAATETYGYSHEEWRALRNADISAEPEETLRATRTTTGKVRIPLRWHRKKDGTVFPVEISARHLTLGGRKVHIAACRDISGRFRAESEQRRLEAQVQHAQKLESLGILAGGIAHDFNNLLVAVLGNAGLAAARLPSDSPAHRPLADIEAAARRASDLCRQLLAYSGRGTFVVEPVDLGRLIEEMVSLLRVSISKKVDLRLDLAARPLAIHADATQLRQVVLNLVVNASEAIGENDGMITVSTGTIEASRGSLEGAYVATDMPEGECAYLRVADTGAGMDASTRRRLFDPFFTTKFAGRGLGLSAVMGIVRGHRGAIEVSSEPGRGTSFRVLLPLLAGQRLPERATAAAAAMESWRGSGTVLVIDDEPAVGTVAAEMLESLGFTALVAGDGGAGVEAFRARADEVALVLLDLTMPKLGGKEALTEIRRVRGDVPVVLMSGYGEAEAAQLLAGQQLNGFLEKPFGAARLAQVLRQALEPVGRDGSEGPGGPTARFERR